MNSLFGIQVLEDSNMVDAHSRVRAWKERLFSWPWRPWVRTLVWHTPSESIYLLKLDDIGEKLICHPAMTRRLSEIGKREGL